MNNKDLKYKLQQITSQYKHLYPDEYRQTVLLINAKRKDLQNEYADLAPGKSTYVQRAIVEWPETLFGMLKVKLTEDEYKGIFNDKSHAMIRWYANEYPEFRVTKST